MPGSAPPEMLAVPRRFDLGASRLISSAFRFPAAGFPRPLQIKFTRGLSGRSGKSQRRILPARACIANVHSPSGVSAAGLLWAVVEALLAAVLETALEALLEEVPLLAVASSSNTPRTP